MDQNNRANESRIEPVELSRENESDRSMFIHRDDISYFNALVDARPGANAARAGANGTAGASLATLFRGVSENASRRFAEGKQRLAA